MRNVLMIVLMWCVSLLGADVTPVSLTTPKPANTVLAGPSSGGSALPTFRAAVAADIPSLPASQITSGVFAPGRLGTGTASTSTFLRGDSTWQTVTGGAAPDNLTINSGGAGGTLQIASYPALSGAAITGLNASNLSSGTVPDARFPATLPAASGVNLTALNASNLSSGTVPDARFPATLPAASGVNLTALNASNLSSGTVPDARFPATLPAASGVNLTALNASNLSSGTLPDARLTSNVPLKDTSNRFGAPTTDSALIDNMFAASATIQTPLVIQAKESQTANLFEVQRSDGSVPFYIDRAGGLNVPLATLTFTGDVANGVVLKDYNSTFGTVTTVDPNSTITVSPINFASKPLVLQGVLAQTANLLEWQDSTGAILSYVDAVGAHHGSFIGSFAGDATGLTNVPSGTLLGALPALDGSALTNLTAANVSGSFPTLSVASGNFSVDSTGYLATTYGMSIAGFISLDSDGGISTPGTIASDATSIAGNLLTFPDISTPSTPGSGGLFYATGGHPACIGTAGIEVTLASHSEDGPPSLYDNVGLDFIHKSVSTYTGTIEWINETRLSRKLDGEIVAGKCRMVETFADYNARKTGTTLTQRDFNADKTAAIAASKKAAKDQADRKAKFTARWQNQIDNQAKRKAAIDAKHVAWIALSAAKKAKTPEPLFTETLITMPTFPEAPVDVNAVPPKPKFLK